MIEAKAASRRLEQGNRVFVSRLRGTAAADSQPPLALVEQQQPFAVILGCADARVAPELIFNQALGDLFVIRVAGNIAHSDQIASVEYALLELGTRLVVVLGHTSCGAVQASVDSVLHATGAPSSHLASIIDAIRPSITPLLESSPDQDRSTLVRTAVRANIAASVATLRERSTVIADHVQNHGAQIVGAEYDLHTGEVSFDGYGD